MEKKTSKFAEIKGKIDTLLKWYTEIGIPSNNAHDVIEKQAELIAHMNYITSLIATADINRRKKERDYSAAFTEGFNKMKTEGFSDERARLGGKFTSLGMKESEDLAEVEYASYRRLFSVAEKMFDAMRSFVSLAKQEQNNSSTNG